MMSVYDDARQLVTDYLNAVQRGEETGLGLSPRSKTKQARLYQETLFAAAPDIAQALIDLVEAAEKASENVRNLTADPDMYAMGLATDLKVIADDLEVLGTRSGSTEATMANRNTQPDETNRHPTPEQIAEMRERHERIVRQRRVSPDDAAWLLHAVLDLLNALEAVEGEAERSAKWGLTAIEANQEHKASIQRIVRERDDYREKLRRIQSTAQAYVDSPTSPPLIAGHSVSVVSAEWVVDAAKNVLDRYEP